MRSILTTSLTTDSKMTETELLKASYSSVWSEEDHVLSVSDLVNVKQADRAFWNSRSPNIYFSNRKDGSEDRADDWRQESSIITTQIPPDRLIGVWHDVWCIYSHSVLLILPLVTASLRRPGGFLTPVEIAVWICASLSRQICLLVATEAFDKRVTRS